MVKYAISTVMWHPLSEELNIVPSLEEAIKSINQMFLGKHWSQMAHLPRSTNKVDDIRQSSLLSKLNCSKSMTPGYKISAIVNFLSSSLQAQRTKAQLGIFEHHSTFVYVTSLVCVADQVWRVVPNQFLLVRWTHLNSELL